MKKLLAVSLFMFSSMAFAETITPELLVGKWHCKAEVDLFNHTSYITEITMRDYKDDGTYTFEVMGKETLQADPPDWLVLDYTIKGMGYWKVKNNVLKFNRQNILAYQVNPTNNGYFQSEEEYRKDNKFYDWKIEEINKNKLTFGLTEEYAKEVEGNILETCQRIN